MIEMIVRNEGFENKEKPVALMQRIKNPTIKRKPESGSNKC